MVQPGIALTLGFLEINKVDFSKQTIILLGHKKKLCNRDWFYSAAPSVSLQH